MRTLREIGLAIAARRKSLHMKQKWVAESAGVSTVLLSQLEKGHLTEMGVRKLISVCTVLGLELKLPVRGESGNLDELRKELGGGGGLARLQSGTNSVVSSFSGHGSEEGQGSARKDTQ
jgi:transcriptional regulator with XRE-family HTH domain